MKRILLIIVLFIGLVPYTNSQVQYYINLANDYEREYTQNKTIAENLEAEATQYLNLATEYQSLADSCFRHDDFEQYNRYSRMADEASKNAQLRQEMANEARILALEKFNLWQDAVQKMLRARREQEEYLRQNRNH